MKTAAEWARNWGPGSELKAEEVLSGQWIQMLIEDVQRDALDAAAEACQKVAISWGRDISPAHDAAGDCELAVLELKP